MEIATSFVISLISGLATDAGKKILKSLFGNVELINQVEKSYNNAINRWTPNTGIRNKEALKFRDRVDLLKQIILHQGQKETIDKNLHALITIFEEELIKDQLSFNYLANIYYKSFVQSFDSLESKIDQMQSQFSSFISKLENSNLESSFKLDLNSIVEKSIEIPTNHFIRSCKSSTYYIPRTVIHFQDINKKEIYSINKTDNGENLVEIINSNDKIVLLGSAGTGKTFELINTAHSLANSGELFPIFISLNTYTSDQNIEEILPENWQFVPEEKVILLLDGFDEVEPTQLLLAKRKIVQFTKKFPNVKLVISCRTNFYELPSNNKIGTLRGFKPYYLEELSLYDIKQYISTRHTFEAEKFIYSIYDNNLSDLIFNPFFLNLIIESYISNNEQLTNERSRLFREFIDSRLKLDENHYEETYNVKDKKYEALNLLRTVALSMEIVGTRIIDEDNLRKIVPSTDKYQLISYCTVFKKEEGESNNWKFEHNYFQEFLCAEELSKQTFETVKSFISYDNFEKILPTWFNTVAQLISILEINSPLFKSLTDYLIKNDLEILVNVEREKFSIESRTEIFKNIFNHYRELGIWIDSNKFRIRNFAYFGESEDNINYILDIAKDENELDITRLNALNILGNFTFDKYTNTVNLIAHLLQILKKNRSNENFVSRIINTIQKCNIKDKNTSDLIFQVIGKSKSRYIRSAMYKFLESSDDFENYVDYFLSGYKILNSKCAERGEVSLADERWNLKNGLTKFKSKGALLKIIDFYIDNDRLERDISNKEILESIIENSIACYNLQSPEIFESILKLYENILNQHLKNQSKIVDNFFTGTNTQQLAFLQVLSVIESGKQNYQTLRLFSQFIKETNLNQVLQLGEKGKLEADSINRIYWNILYNEPDLAESYKLKITKITGVEIAIPPQLDWDTIRKERVQKSFNLLFKPELFKKECFRVFNGKKEISWDELWDLKKTSLKENVEIEDEYINCSLDLIRDFTRDTPLTKQKLDEWFKHHSNFEHYCINEVYQLLQANDTIEISEQQISTIRNWFEKHIAQVDFTKAITKTERDSYTINILGYQLTYFMLEFNFNCEKRILLDMLSATSNNFHGSKHDLFNFILENVTIKDEVFNRVETNLTSNNISYFNVLETHIEVALQNKITSTYNSIINYLINLDFDFYQRCNIVDTYIENNGDLRILKNILNTLQIDLRLHTLNQLLKKNEIPFVVNNLKQLLQITLSDEQIKTVNNLLISAKEILGLTRSINWIELKKESPFSYHGQGLAHFEDIRALPHLIKFLELSYDSSITSKYSHDGLYGITINGLEHLALSSHRNFKKVIESLKIFISDNIEKFEGVLFLNKTIESLKEKYYNSIVETHNFEQANEKIQKLLIRV